MILAQPYIFNTPYIAVKKAVTKIPVWNERTKNFTIQENQSYDQRWRRFAFSECFLATSQTTQRDKRRIE